MFAIRGLVALLILGTATAWAQPATSLRDQLVGSWDFIIAEIVAGDGTKTLPFGDKPRGLLIFTSDGHFSQVHVASGLPKVASGNRLGGSPEDNTAIVHNSLAMIGTYTVDEEKKTLTFHIKASTFPNLDGVSQTRSIDRLTADEFRNTNAAASRAGPAVASNLYRRTKP
jgi:hypothetical protein